jgi:protein-L-isoaspartate(D-aspartate) O-methyltransferase
MLLPWCAARDTTIALLIKRTAIGYHVEPMMAIRIIPCVGASEPCPEDKRPSRNAAWATRALHLTAERMPDNTATAIYSEVWFSSEPLGGYH